MLTTTQALRTADLLGKDVNRSEQRGLSQGSTLLAACGRGTAGGSSSKAQQHEALLIQL